MRNLYYLLKIIKNSIPYKFRKYVSILLLIMLCFLTFKSFAADGNQYRDPTMWQRERTLNDDIRKSSVNVTATKTYPVSTLGADGKPIVQTRTATSTIKLGATVGNVGKSLVKRAPAIAITYAITAILGKAVDWTMDAENNRIRYVESGASAGSEGSLERGWTSVSPVKYYSSPELACQVSIANADATYGAWSYVSTDAHPNNSDKRMCIGQRVGYDPQPYTSTELSDNPNYTETPPVDPVVRYIPIPTVADQIIIDADSGQAPAMQVMNDTALDMLEEGLLDAQLDAASDYPQPDPDAVTDTTNPPDPETGECPIGYTKQSSGMCIKTEQVQTQFPAFCTWASKVCEFIDWVKTEPTDPPDGDGDISVEIPDSQMHEPILERLYIDMPAQCPPDPVLEFMGARIPFPMSVFCQFATMMKPLILLFAYIKGLSIIGTGLN